MEPVIYDLKLATRRLKLSAFHSFLSKHFRLQWALTLLLFFVATQLFAQDPAREAKRADSLLTLVNKLNRKERFAEANEAAREAYQIHLNLYGPDHAKTARSRMFVARSLKNLDKPEEALRLYQQSLTYFERSKDTLQIALAHFHISLIYRTYRRLEDSRTNLTYAIQLMSADSTRNAYWLAMFNISLAFLYNIENNYEAAIPVLDACKSYYQAQKDTLTLGQIYYHYGNAWYGMQDFERSKEYFLASYDLLNGQLDRDNGSFADLLVMLGFCHQKLGESERGWQYMQMAKNYFDQLPPQHPGYIGNLEDLGVFYTAEGKYDTAVQYLEACFTIVEEKFGPSSIRLLRHLPILADGYLKNGNYQQAETCFRRALRIVADSFQGIYHDKARYYEKLAEISFAQADYASALQRCDSAFLASGIDPLHPEKWHSRPFARELYRQYGQASFQLFLQTRDIALLRQSEQAFEKAATLLQIELRGISVSSSQEVFYNRDHPVLEQWLEAEMRLYAETGDLQFAEKAFRISGQHKSFLLYDAMRQSGALHFSGLPDSILQQEAELRQRIVESEKSMDDAAFDLPLQDSVRMTIGRALTDHRKRYDALLETIAGRFPSYQKLRYSDSETSITEWQQKRLQPGQAILMYSLSATQVFVFVLSRDTFCARTLPLSPGFSEELIQFRKSITAYYSNPNSSEALYDQSLQAYTRLAQSLYQQLIFPVAGLLPERVILIPEGPLCNLPFEALLQAAPKDESNFQTYPFWSKEKAVSYGFSLDLWMEMSRPLAQKAVQKWLGIAPFAESSDLLASATRTGLREALPPLPYSGVEIRTLAAMLHGKAWIGAEARPGRFEKEAHAYSILHFATHSEADDRHGNNSYLATTASGALLHARDLYQLSLAAEMVVLSSCASAEGHLNRGEGIIGLVRAFAYAGARSVVASVWLAQDQSTARLMEEFYRNLLKGQTKALALKNARLQFMKQMPEASHPFFWTGFRLYGNDDALWN